MDIKQIVKEGIQSRGVYTTSTNKVQWYTRCPYCGDSRNQNHAHLSIKIDMNSDAPMVYRCFKCNVSGLVDVDFLNDLDIFIDQDQQKVLRAYTRKAMRFSRLSNNDKESFFVPVYEDNPLNRSKLNYVNQRLGTEIDFEKAKDYKILLNLFDFMAVNEMQKEAEYFRPISYRILQMLHNDYVGFLSTNNNSIVFRDITGMNKMRYYKAVINLRNINRDSFYLIPTKFSILYTEPVHIHLAEGIFDILSIKENVVIQNDHEIHLFFATCGFGSRSAISYCIRHGLTTGIHLHIYADRDKSNHDHRKDLFGKVNYSEWVEDITIHRNAYADEKDFGVPKDRIQETTSPFALRRS